MRNKKDLSSELIESFTSKEAMNAAASMADVGLNSLLDEGLLNDLPVFGSLIKGVGLVSSVRDRYYFSI